MSTWYEEAVFYHMYPLGMTGAPKQNTKEGKRDGGGKQHRKVRPGFTH